jgi:WD40 repeat protein
MSSGDDPDAPTGPDESEFTDSWPEGAHPAPLIGGSVAGVWSAPGAEVELPTPSFHHEGPRYEAGTVIGSGGMGKVSATRDRLLRREVARKDLVVGAPLGAAERLTREARITAQLEHPGIVAVYDAGTHPGGSPWYSMRLIRGRTLSDVLAEATPTDRPRLLRSVLAACQAVAFAHARGVIHRDLKPDNILVGAFGETQVIDWGLACFVDEPVESMEAGPIGTPAYMSPEQVQGTPADKRSDVWSLGATLYAAATGAWPFEGAGAHTTLDQRGGRAGSEPPPMEGPPELAAIAHRALSLHPDGRYADASELANDLERYLDGRPVAAHDYSPLEVLLGLARVWKAPLLVGALALVVLAVVGATAWVGNSRERARAQQAEVAAEAARLSAKTHLGQALVSQARTAASAGDRVRAEALALAALEGGESPEARGVLVAVDEGWRPERLVLGPELDCERFGVGPADSFACEKDSIVELRGPGGQRLGWVPMTEPGQAEPGSNSGSGSGSGSGFNALPGGEILTWNAITGTSFRRSVGVSGESEIAKRSLHFSPEWVAADPAGERVVLGRALDWWLVDLADFALTRLDPCKAWVNGRSPLWIDGQIVVLCSDGTVAKASEAGGDWPFEHQDFPDPRAVRAPGILAAWGADGLMVGTHHGVLALVDRHTLEVRSSVEIASPSITSLEVSGESDWVAARSEVGAVQVWRPGDPRAVVVPTTAGLIDVDVNGDLVTLGDRRNVWRIPPRPAPREVSVTVGLTGVQLSPKGEFAAAGRGDGWAALWNLSTGAIDTLEVRAGPTVKSVVFSQDGSGFAAAVASPAPISTFTADGTPAGQLGFAAATRRLVVLADGTYLRIGWSPSGPTRVGPALGGETYVGWPGWHHELVASPSGERVALSGPDGLLTAALEDGIWVPTKRPEFEANQLALADDGSFVGTVQGTGAADEPAGYIVGVDGVLEREFLPGGRPVTSVAISPSGDLVAMGDLRGFVRVWDRRTGDLLVDLVAHRERASGLAFRSDRELVSASWDGTLRRWYLDSMGKAPQQLRAEAGAWAITLEEALGTPLR